MYKNHSIAVVIPAYNEEKMISQVLNTMPEFIDAIIVDIWHHFELKMSSPDAVAPVLVAVGGYGRGELHPNSDIDLLILLPDNIDDSFSERIERFIMLLWDIGLEVGHSVVQKSFEWVIKVRVCRITPFGPPSFDSISYSLTCCSTVYGGRACWPSRKVVSVTTISLSFTELKMNSIGSPSTYSTTG